MTTTSLSKKDGDLCYNRYMDSMARIVEEYKQKYPEKYDIAQKCGEDIVDDDYNLTLGVDKTRDEKILSDLITCIKEYSLTEEDLTVQEKKLLVKNNIIFH